MKAKARAGAGRGTRPAAVTRSPPDQQDRGSRRPPTPPAALGTGLSAAQPHRRRPDHRVDRGRPARPSICAGPARRPIGEIVLAAAGGLSTRPEQILISSPDGAATPASTRTAWPASTPITTDRLDITISRGRAADRPQPGRRRGPCNSRSASARSYVPALDRLRTPQPDRRPEVLRCRAARARRVAVDGTLHATSASGTVRDLTERRPVEVTLCRTARPAPTAARPRAAPGGGGRRRCPRRSPTSP